MSCSEVNFFQYFDPLSILKYVLFSTNLRNLQRTPPHLCVDVMSGGPRGISYFKTWLDAECSSRGPSDFKHSGWLVCAMRGSLAPLCDAEKKGFFYLASCLIQSHLNQGDAYIVSHHVEYRDRLKCMQILLSRTQAGPGRAAKQEQEQTSRNHVQTF